MRAASNKPSGLGRRPARPVAAAREEMSEDSPSRRREWARVAVRSFERVWTSDCRSGPDRLIYWLLRVRLAGSDRPESVFSNLVAAVEAARRTAGGSKGLLLARVAGKLVASMKTCPSSVAPAKKFDLNFLFSCDTCRSETRLGVGSISGRPQSRARSSSGLAVVRAVRAAAVRSGSSPFRERFVQWNSNHTQATGKGGP